MERVYKASAKKSNYKGNVQYYPIVMYSFKNQSDNFWLNEPKKTRYLALKAAKQYIKNQN